jgi:uncharacterized membrane protein YoaK (UPF0700 family)
VFVANMTGNIIFLGFAAVGTGGFSIVGSVLALTAFLGGALAGGRMSRTVGRARALRDVAIVKVTLLAIAAGVGIALPLGSVTLLLVVLLAATMGLQSAVARMAGLDLPTTVLTMTLTGLAADSHWAGGTQPNIGRRVAAVIAMLLGAALGCVLFRFDPRVPLVLATACMAVTLAGAHRVAGAVTPS